MHSNAYIKLLLKDLALYQTVAIGGQRAPIIKEPEEQQRGHEIKKICASRHHKAHSTISRRHS